eukprot:g3003.t1
MAFLQEEDQRKEIRQRVLSSGIRPVLERTLAAAFADDPQLKDPVALLHKVGRSLQEVAADSAEDPLVLALQREKADALARGDGLAEQVKAQDSQMVALEEELEKKKAHLVEAVRAADLGKELSVSLDEAKATEAALERELDSCKEQSAQWQKDLATMTTSTVKTKAKINGLEHENAELKEDVLALRAAVLKLSTDPEDMPSPRSAAGKDASGKDKGDGKKAGGSGGGGGGGGLNLAQGGRKDGGGPRHEVVPKRNMKRTPDRNRTDGSTDFSLMEFNVLGGTRAMRRPVWYKTSLKKDCFDWDFRKVHIMSEIRRYYPDVLVLMAVEHYEDFLNPRLSAMGYAGLYKRRCRPRNEAAAAARWNLPPGESLSTSPAEAGAGAAAAAAAAGPEESGSGGGAAGASATTDPAARPDSRGSLRSAGSGGGRPRSPGSKEADAEWADGVAIFYKISRFELSTVRTIEFRDFTSLGEEASNASEVGLVVALTDRRSKPDAPRHICVGCGELCDTVESPHIRLEQTWLLVSQLQAVMESLPGAAAILTGTLNFTPGSECYRLVTEGAARFSYTDIVWDYGLAEAVKQMPQTVGWFPWLSERDFGHEMSLASIYRTYNPDPHRSKYAYSTMTHEPPFTVVNEGQTAAVDYIFCSENVFNTHYLDLFDERFCKRHRGLPSPKYPSDHVALMGRFSFAVASERAVELDEARSTHAKATIRQ